MWRLALRSTRRVSAPSGSAAWASLQRAACAVELPAHDRHVVADLLRGGRLPCQTRAHHGLWTHAWVAHAPLLPPTCPVRHLSTSPPSPPEKEPPPPQSRQQRRPALARGTPDGVNAGWTYDEVVNAPNALSLGRAVSGPVLAVFILQVRSRRCLSPLAPFSDSLSTQGHCDWALYGLALAGASDWADGYLARRLKLTTVLGSYLDPLADKALFAPVAVAMAATQLLPPWLVLLAVGRDVALVAGAFVFRARAMDWKIPSLREFFRMVPLSPQDGDGAAGSPAAPRVQPLLVSKLNTVLQIGTATAALATAAWGLPGQEVVDAGVLACAGTTVVSGAMYLRMAMSGRYRA